MPIKIWKTISEILSKIWIILFILTMTKKIITRKTKNYKKIENLFIIYKLI